MKRIDAYKDGQLILKNQALSNPTVAARIKTMMLSAKTEVIVREHLSPPAGFGSAGIFHGRGIMLGSNRDVWGQAVSIHRDGGCDVVAVVPGTPRSFFPNSLKVVGWVPPHLEPRDSNIHQAENPNEWANIVADPLAEGACLNSWEYGKLNGQVALVEIYANEGWPLNFEEFKNYMPQGASGVVPLCGGYHAGGRSDADSAAIYASLAKWASWPGFWMYAGESYLTDESVAVLKAWKP